MQDPYAKHGHLAQLLRLSPYFHGEPVGGSHFQATCCQLADGQQLNTVTGAQLLHVNNTAWCSTHMWLLHTSSLMAWLSSPGIHAAVPGAKANQPTLQASRRTTNVPG